MGTWRFTLEENSCYVAVKSSYTGDLEVQDFYFDKNEYEIFDFKSGFI